MNEGAHGVFRAESKDLNELAFECLEGNLMFTILKAHWLLPDGFEMIAVSCLPQTLYSLLQSSKSRKNFFVFALSHGFYFDLQISSLAFFSVAGLSFLTF